MIGEIKVSRHRSTYGFIHIFDERPSRYLRPGTISLCGISRVPSFSSDWMAPPDKFCKKCIERLKTLQRDVDKAPFTVTERI